MMEKRAYRLVAGMLSSISLAAVLFFMHGAETVLFVSLLLVCAYLNAMFLAAPLDALKQRDAKSIAIVVGAALANMAVLHFTDFSLVATVVVWLPAVAGLVAVALLRGR